MSKDNKPISVTIMGEEYLVACSPEEQEGLVASARYLSEKMKEIRASGRVLTAERIAVMAALNITHDMLQLREKGESEAVRLTRRLKTVREKVEAALAASNQLEL